jgi:hypothetical protein
MMFSLGLAVGSLCVLFPAEQTVAMITAAKMKKSDVAISNLCNHPEPYCKELAIAYSSE